MERLIITVILFGALICFGAPDNLLKNNEFSIQPHQHIPNFWELQGKSSAFSFDRGVAVMDNSQNQSSSLLLIQRDLAVKAEMPWDIRFQVQGTGFFSAYVEWVLPEAGGIRWRNVIIENQYADMSRQQYRLRFIPEAGFRALKLVLRAEKGSRIMFSQLKLIKDVPLMTLELPPADWKPEGIKNAGIVGEGLYGEITGPTNSLTSAQLNPAISGSEISSIQFELQIPAGASDKASFLYRTAGMREFTPDKSLTIPIKGDGTLHFYNISIPEAAVWQGQIVQFKFIPAVNAQKNGAFQLNNFKVNFVTTAATVATKATAVFKIDPLKFTAGRNTSYPRAMFNDAGAILVDGQPQFILGSAPAMVPGMLREMEEAGFNHIWFPECFPSEWICRELARGNIRLMGYLPPGYNESATSYKERLSMRWNKVAPFAAPILLFWHNFDEPTWRKIPVESTALYYNGVRELQPRRPVVMTHAPRNTVEELIPYSRQGDIVCVDIYPVPVGYHSELRNKTMSCVGEYADKTLETATSSQPLWMWLQAYSRGGYPDFHQTRFMAYNAIMHGATGILYYGLEHVPWPDNPMWPVLKKVGPELRSLNDVLVSPWQTPLEKSEGVELRIKRTGDGQICLLVANTFNVPRELRLQVPESLKTLYVDFAGRKLTSSNGQIKDVLAPYDVRLYSTTPRNIPVINSKLTNSELTVLLDGTAKYIWDEKNRRNTGKKIWFRRQFDSKTIPETAGMVISGDDNYKLYCNEQLVGQDWDFSAGGRYLLKYYDLKPFLKQGRNLIALESLHDSGNAGFWSEIYLGNTMLQTDAAWRCRDYETNDWNHVNLDDRDWSPVKTFGTLGADANSYFLRYFLIREKDLQKLKELRKNIQKETVL